MPTCKQGAGRNPDPGTRYSLPVCPAEVRRAEMGSRNAIRGRDAVPRAAPPRCLSNQRHEIVRVRAEPRLAHEKPPTHLAPVIIEDNLPAVDPNMTAWSTPLLPAPIRGPAPACPRSRYPTTGLIRSSLAAGPGSHIQPCNSLHLECADRSRRRTLIGFCCVRAA